MLVTDELDFDMGGVFQVTLEEHPGAAKSVFRDLPGAFDQGHQFFLRVDDVDADAAASLGRFDHQREAQLPCLGRGVLVGHSPVRAWEDGETSFPGQLATADLIAHLFHDIRVRADKTDARLLAETSEISVFREETVSGMDSLGARRLGDVKYLGHV